MASPERIAFGKDLAKTTAKSIAAGIPAGLLGVGVIIVRNHKELAHRNIKLSPLVQKMMDFEQRTSGVGEPEVWAAVHREPHHQRPDTNLYPFYKIARSVRWLEANPDKAKGIVVPEYFKKLDPGVIKFSLEDVLKIGNLEDEYMREKLGDEYKELDEYDDPVRQITEILNPNPNQPRFWYKPYERHVGEWTQDDIAEILLTDPHSPALMPPRKGRINGVRGVKRSNLFLYKKAANLFRAGERPDLKPADLQTGKEDQYKKPWKEVTAGFVVPAAVIFAARARKGRHTWKDVLVATVAGSAFNGVRLGLKIWGGNEVNSIGHPGDLRAVKDLLEAEFASDFYILPNEEGRYTNDTSRSGPAGRAIKIATGDEGDQDSHHKHPERIRHTQNPDLKGFAAFIDTPTGSPMEFAAKNKYIPGIHMGEGFGDIPLDQRPDMPNEAVLLIEQRRREQREELLQAVQTMYPRQATRIERLRTRSRSMLNDALDRLPKVLPDSKTK